MKLNAKSLKKELQKRVSKKTFNLPDLCFKEQLDFINDTSKYKVACTTRRAGKTTALALMLIKTCLETPQVDALYVTLSRINAKKIIWRDLLYLNKEYDLGGKPNQVDLTITFPNNSMIHIGGAKDENAIENFRGLRLKIAVIDEAQSFRTYIKELVEESIEPTLLDYDGSIVLTGTPGPVPAGYFYEATQGTGWSNHRWSLINNLFLEKKSGKNPEQILAEIRTRRGISEDDPSYRREFKGEWVYDYDSLVYKFDVKRNVTNTVPTKDLDYVLGIDIGFQDSDAIAVLGFDRFTTQVYLVEEFIKDKQNITELANQIKKLQEKYKPVRMVMDAGALGKKIQEEIRDRHGLHVEAAEKTRKYEFIELLNDDLRTGRFKCIPGSSFQEDCFLVQWDYTNPDKVKVSDRYHTDIGDAVLYAWRECRNFTENQKPITKNLYSAAWEEAEEKRLAHELQQRLSGQNDNVSYDDLKYIFDDE